MDDKHLSESAPETSKEPNPGHVLLDRGTLIYINMNQTHT